MGQPILEVSTLAPERATIKIKSAAYPDGKLYEVASVDDLSIADQQFLYSRGVRLEALMERRKELKDAEKEELNHIVDGMVNLVVLGLEKEVREALPGMGKIQVVEAFIAASPGLAKAAARLQQETQTPPSPTTQTTGK